MTYWVHNLDPVAVQIGPVAIHWYGLAYMVAILAGWQVCLSLTRRSGSLVPRQAIDDIMVWIVLGVLIGGRMGEVLFYYPEFYLRHPAEIFKIWKGGMSFHGGLAGVVLAVALYCRKRGLSFPALIDLIAFAAPFGIMLGRIANFINAEHVGRPVEHSLENSFLPAVIFPTIDMVPRHASQLYQAALEGALPLVILLILLKPWQGSYPVVLRRPGLVAGYFLVMNGIARMIGEQFRTEEIAVNSLPLGLTYGQILSLPVLLVGLFLVFRARSNAPLASPAGSG